MNLPLSQNFNWKYNVLWSFALIIATLLIEFWMFGNIIFSPNQYMICGNADGRQIYFNVLWHVKYGSGYVLSNQNHPYYESIFMTDAQGFLSMMLSYINHHIVKIDQYTMGIFNALLLYSIPLSSLSLFAVFNSLRVNKYIGFVFALIITLMSPQILRMVSGHYGLGYLFQFPLMAFLFITLRRYNFSLKMSMLFILIFIMGLNNGHLAMAGILFLLSFGLASKFYKKDVQDFPKNAIIISAILIAILFYGVVKFTDFVSDREAYPWGFLHYYSQFESIYLPAQGKVFELYSAICPVKIQEPNSEGIAYVGVMGFLMQIFMLVRVILFFIKKKKNRILRPTLNRNLNILLLASYFILTYAMIIPIRFKLEFLVDYFPFLHQFRAPGRFAWIFYYVFLIYVAYMLNVMYRLFSIKQKKYISIMLLVSTCALFAFEVEENRQFNFRYHINLNYEANIFSHQKKDETLFQKLHLDTANYSSICAIPVWNQWSGKFGSTEDKHLLTTKMLTCSYFSGVPWLNSKLSRVSTSQTMRSGQFTSNELIRREIFKDLDTSKKILLVYFKEHQKTKSEQYVLYHSKLLHEDSMYAFYAFEPNQAFYKTKDSILSNFDSLKLNFDASEAKQHNIIHKYFDGRARMVSDADTEKLVLDTFLNYKSMGEKMEISLWSLVDYRTQNSPVVKFVRTNAKQEMIEEKYVNPARSEDVQHLKLRVQYNYEAKFLTERIQIYLPKGKNHMFERILLRSEAVQVYDTISKVKYLNNYILD